ncbi:fasciclin and related adhesion glycoprotein [Tripterygium wilfordii]|uniref:Fasciclin and related adhesion glycoprotein n=1 Tax=Tripterygium wilfordii TaxID=458696 RepID=A0A7J7BZY4_TRIWF|nr:fasciclin-like arabinogalactan protein 12 [Tripterygium wilfordii]KAF5727444.1 fasciclin and related adhesion glycoprotein [Tripterygium wilfordii]
MLKQTTFFASSLIFLCFLHCSTLILSQAPALAPAPPGPTNVTKILEKAGSFSVLIRLLKSSQIVSNLNNQLNDSNNGITIFAPSDNAFSSLKPGTLNSLTDQQQSELLQFHMIPSYLTTSQFQTVSNPLRTQAGGDVTSGRFAFNITTTGNSVNITTGLTNTSVSGTVYTDGQLAIYQVDKVLLPIDVFTPKPPAPAPAPEKPKKKKHISEGPSTAADASGAVSNYILITFNVVVVYGVAIVAAMLVTL